ncbi:MAG: Ada metal-binding domain-containing protein, partial [Mycobacterium leprae]
MQEEEWRAITQCDPAYDGQFYYAVKTTGIFCRPSCKSRVPNRGNVIVFHSAHAAVEAGFRACKRCRPDQCHGPAAELVQRALDYMAVHYSEPLTLSL